MDINEDKNFFDDLNRIANEMYEKIVKDSPMNYVLSFKFKVDLSNEFKKEYKLNDSIVLVLDSEKK
jgi:hypothetical protein